MLPNECVNPTYQASEDSDSHHYIEPMDWTRADIERDDAQSDSEREERSPELRRRLTNIRDQLPSKNIDVDHMTDDDESVTGEDAARRHNSNLAGLRFRTAAVRQIDQDTLFQLLSSNRDATSDEIHETLRNVNQSLTLKRQVKARLSQEEAKQKHKTISFNRRVKYHIAMNWQHLCQELWTLQKSLDLWHSHLKAVQGHFGSGVASYFFFLRRLFILNVLACILIVCFIVIPQAVFDSDQKSSNSIDFNGYDLLTGDGSFRNTVLYYGHYTNATVNGYKMPEAYLFTNIAYIICCLFVLTFSVARTYRMNYIETAGELKNVFANKLLSAWDYSIEEEAAARLKSRSIYNELLELIAGETHEELSEDLSSRLFMYLWRILINLLILAAMVATGYLTHFLLTENYFKDVDIPVLKEITVALVVTGLSFFVPFIFSLVSSWEKYSSKQTQIYLNVVRVVMLRVVILGVVITFWLMDTTRTTKDNSDEATSVTTEAATVISTAGSGYNSRSDAIQLQPGQRCWESKLGQEMYRLLIVDFLCILLLPTLVMELLRRLCYDHCCQWVGFPEFDIAQNTLDLVYTQMLVWVGLFYSPLLPFIAVCKLLIIFYVKRLSVIQNCRPPRRAWRAAHAQTLFLTLTFLCFMLSFLSLGYSIINISSSSSCGPFRQLGSAYELVLSLITSVKGDILSTILSPGVVAGLLLFLCVVVYYKRATAKANMDMVKLLREQLTLEGKDKVFLLRLFENAMTQQQICSYMKKNSQATNNFGGGGDTAFVESRNKTEASMPNAQYPNELPAENQSNSIPQDKLFKDRVRELQQQQMYNSGSSSSREASPFTYQSSNVPGTKVYSPSGHRFDARDSPPFSPSPYSSRQSTPRDGSPYTSSPRQEHSISPQGTWDRRGSEASQRSQAANQVPRFYKPTHQHGFRQLTPGPGPSRQTTPQRF